MKVFVVKGILFFMNFEIFDAIFSLFGHKSPKNQLHLSILLIAHLVLERCNLGSRAFIYTQDG